MKYLKTNGKYSNSSVILDDEDYLEQSKFNWYMQNKGYAARSVHYYKPNGSRSCRTILLHREILKTNNLVDHINGNTLDNRRINLRPCNINQNSYNRKPSANISGFKGVFWHERTKKWMVVIIAKKVRYYRGLFGSKEEGAKEYNRMAIKLFGEFANLNIIKE